MSIDPKQLAEWKALGKVLLSANATTAQVVTLAHSVPALIAEVERLSRPGVDVLVRALESERLLDEHVQTAGKHLRGLRELDKQKP